MNELETCSWSCLQERSKRNRPCRATKRRADPDSPSRAAFLAKPTTTDGEGVKAGEKEGTVFLRSAVRKLQEQTPDAHSIRARRERDAGEQTPTACANGPADVGAGEGQCEEAVETRVQDGRLQLVQLDTVYLSF